MTTTLAPATESDADAIARLAAFCDSYDADLLNQAHAIATARTLDDMRAYLASKGDSYAGDPDASMVRATFLGYAQAVLAEVARMAERQTAAGK